MKSSLILSILFTLQCPAPDAVQVTPQTGSWAMYRYDAVIPIDLPELGNQLHLTAEGNAAHANQFFASTWTDRTFLCLYNAGFDTIVLFDTALDQRVSRCYFNVSGVHSSECEARDPAGCSLICERV